MMGVVKKGKGEQIRSDAARAIAEGRSVFLARFWDEVIAYQGTGAISGGSEAIELVEAEGWQLQDIAYSWVPAKNRGVTILVFRRQAAR